MVEDENQFRSNSNTKYMDKWINEMLAKNFVVWKSGEWKKNQYGFI